MRSMKDSGIAWIGEIPESWRIAQLKRFVHVNNGKEIEEEIDKCKDAVPVYGSGGIFKYTNNVMFDGEAVMFGRKGTLGKPIYVNGKFWTVDTMYYLTFKTSLFPKFNYYQLQIFDWMPHITQTALPSIVASEIASCLFAFPDYDKQKRIVSFLDMECAQIDEVMEQTRASIEEYKKMKQAVITQAVTKGIRPNRSMKDSGVDWIGTVPCDWTIQKLKNIIIAIESGVSVNAAQYPAQEGEIGVLKTSCVSKFNFLPVENKAVNQEEYDRVACPVKANTIIMSRMNTPDLVGACGYVSEDYPKLYLPDRLWQVHFSAQANVKYIWYYLNCRNVRNYYASLAVGTSSSMQNISQDQFYNTFVPIPTAEEQKEIVVYLDEKIPEIDALVDKKEKLISELESYKKSMIYEYVTGKKEVM